MGSTAAATALWIAVALAAGAAGAAGEDDEARVKAFWVTRMAEAASELSRAPAGYVLVMGDSNAQSLSRPPCPGTFVNAGMGGIGARRYRELLTAEKVPDGGSVAILNVGTGDMVRKRDPAADAAVASYEADVEAIVSHVRPHVARVVVNALPPVSGRFATKLDPDAIALYSRRLGTLCARIGCTYADPWSYARGESFGLARPELVADGLHPDDPNRAYASIASLACPGSATGRR